MSREKAIEATKEALQKEFGGFLAHDPHDPERFWRMTATAVVEAAAPFLEADVLREAAEQAHVLEGSDDPTRSAFYWLRSLATRKELGGRS